MAYLNTAEPAPAALSSTFAWTGKPAAPAGETGFVRREWQVIELAGRDSLDTLREPSWLSRLLDGLFGGGGNPRLADPRLEALRRLAVLAWHHGYALPVSAMKAFKAAGFSVDQLELLLASTAAGRNARRRRAVA